MTRAWLDCFAIVSQSESRSSPRREDPLTQRAAMPLLSKSDGVLSHQRWEPRKDLQLWAAERHEAESAASTECEADGGPDGTCGARAPRRHIREVSGHLNRWQQPMQASHCATMRLALYCRADPVSRDCISLAILSRSSWVRRFDFSSSWYSSLATAALSPRRARARASRTLRLSGASASP